MQSVNFCVRAVVIATIAVPLNFVFSEPGDFRLEVIASTNDSTPITEITYGSLAGGAHPVSIDDQGSVTFAAKTLVGNFPQSGIFHYRNSLISIAETGTPAPGVTISGEPTLMQFVPAGAYDKSGWGISCSDHLRYQ